MGIELVTQMVAMADHGISGILGLDSLSHPVDLLSGYARQKGAYNYLRIPAHNVGGRTNAPASTSLFLSSCIHARQTYAQGSNFSLSPVFPDYMYVPQFGKIPWNIHSSRGTLRKGRSRDTHHMRTRRRVPRACDQPLDRGHSERIRGVGYDSRCHICDWQCT